jgi:hypothetical protein
VPRKFSYKPQETFTNSTIKNLVVKKILNIVDINSQAREEESYRPIESECLCLCLGSVVFSSLENKFRESIPVIQNLVHRRELNILYNGSNKIQSIDDALLFFPNIFKQQRSLFFTTIRREKNTN